MSEAQEVSAPEQVEEQVISEIETEETQEEIQEEPQAEEVEVQAESEAELKEEVEEAIKDGATEEEVASMIRQYELKVNGKTFVKEVDLADDSKVQQILQREAAGQMAMQEAAELKKAYEQELIRLKQNPWEILKELGLDERELVENKIQDLIEQDKKTPEEVERENIQKELAAARKKAEEAEKKLQDQEDQRLFEQESQKLQDEIQTALDAHTTLHASPKIKRMVAEVMEFAMDNGFDDVSAEDVLPTVEDRLIKEMNEIFGDIKDEDLIKKYLGEDSFNRIRKPVEKAPAKPKTSISELKSESAKPAPKEDKKRPKVRLDDFMRRR